jgi:hypothetical protein
MNDVTVDDALDEGGFIDEEEAPSVNKLCMVDVAELGWKKIDEMGIKQTRSIAESRRKRKRELTQKMLKRAQLLRDQSQLVQVAVEKMDVEDAPFHDYVRSLRPELYRKRVSAQCETPSR